MEKQSEMLNFKDVETFETPYKHFLVKNVLDKDTACSILSWLEVAEEFVPRNEQWYRSSAFHVSSHNVPITLQDFFSLEVLGNIKSQVEDLFDKKFKSTFMCSANLYIPGQGTLIHTDYVQPKDRDEYNYFTHRFLLYLNNEWTENDGGKLGLFSGPNAWDMVKTVSPIHNTGVGLEITPHSYHAVSAVKSGRRFTLNFTFTEKTSDEDQ